MEGMKGRGGKADSQITNLSNWKMLVLFSEINNSAGGGLGAGRDDVFCFNYGASEVSETLIFIH